MEYSSRLKGAITQTLLKSMLTDAGYKVVPLGVEEVIREVTTLDETKYKELKLPDILRKMPDFFVSDPDLTKCWLVEVKYRKIWDANTQKELKKVLEKQAGVWGSIYVIIFLGTPVSEQIVTLPFAWVGVANVFMESGILKVHTTDKGDVLWDKMKWGMMHMQRIQDVFILLNKADKWKEATLMKTLSINSTLINNSILNE